MINIFGSEIILAETSEGQRLRLAALSNLGDLYDVLVYPENHFILPRYRETCRKLANNRELAIAAFRENHVAIYSAIKYMFPDFGMSSNAAEYVAIRQIANQKPMLIDFIHSPEISIKTELCEIAVAVNPLAIKFCPSSIFTRSDRIVHRAIMHNSDVLKYLEEVRDDSRIISYAAELTKQNSKKFNLEYTSNRLHTELLFDF